MKSFKTRIASVITSFLLFTLYTIVFGSTPLHAHDTSNTEPAPTHGTSFATLVVEAKAAHVIASHSDLTAKVIRSQLTNNRTKNWIEAKNASNVKLVAAQCNHQCRGAYDITKQPTCTTDGEKRCKCYLCGEYITRSSIPKLGHSYGSWKTTQAATCTKSGTRKRTCSRCGAVQSQTISATGHTFNGVFEITKAATCTATGTKVGKCTKCGAVVTSSTIPALGHSYGAWTTTKASTCTTSGSKKRTCTRCKAVQTQTISATGHSFNGQFNISKQPTCTEPGERVGRCTKCNAIVARSEIPALGHVHGSWKTIVGPTCVSDGVKVEICGRCNSTMGSATVAPAFGHSGPWATEIEPTCLKEGRKVRTCTLCGMREVEKIPPLGGNHVVTTGYTVEKEPTCAKPGSEVQRCYRCNEILSRRSIPALDCYEEYPNFVFDDDPLSRDDPIIIFGTQIVRNASEDSGGYLFGNLHDMAKGLGGLVFCDEDTVRVALPGEAERIFARPAGKLSAPFDVEERDECNESEKVTCSGKSACFIVRAEYMYPNPDPEYVNETESDNPETWVFNNRKYLFVPRYCMKNNDPMALTTECPSWNMSVLTGGNLDTEFVSFGIGIGFGIDASNKAVTITSPTVGVTNGSSVGLSVDAQLCLTNGNLDDLAGWSVGGNFSIGSLQFATITNRYGLFSESFYWSGFCIGGNLNGDTGKFTAAPFGASLLMSHADTHETTNPDSIDKINSDIREIAKQIFSKDTIKAIQQHTDFGSGVLTDDPNLSEAMKELMKQKNGILLEDFLQLP